MCGTHQPVYFHPSSVSLIVRELFIAFWTLFLNMKWVIEILNVFFYLIFFPCLLTLSLLSYLVSHLLLCGVNTHILHTCLEHYVISVSVFFFVMVYSHERRKGGKRRSTKYMSSTYTDWMNKNCMRQLFSFYVMFCIHYMRVYVCIFFFFCLYHNWSQLSSLNMNFLSYLISKYICLLWMIQYLIHIWQFKWGELWVES